MVCEPHYFYSPIIRYIVAIIKSNFHWKWMPWSRLMIRSAFWAHLWREWIFRNSMLPMTESGKIRRHRVRCWRSWSMLLWTACFPVVTLKRHAKGISTLCSFLKGCRHRIMLRLHGSFPFICLPVPENFLPMSLPCSMSLERYQGRRYLLMGRRSNPARTNILSSGKSLLRKTRPDCLKRSFLLSKNANRCMGSRWYITARQRCILWNGFAENSIESKKRKISLLSTDPDIEKVSCRGRSKHWMGIFVN